MDIVSEDRTGIVREGELSLVESFDVWYLREHDRMIATLVLSTGEIELAVEGVDEACSRALERWNRVGAMDSPSGWVYRVAINHARRVARRRAMEQRFFHKEIPTTDLPAPAGELWILVAALPERQRQVVMLRHVAGLKESEIGAVLGISRGTVSSTLYDAHERLGRLLKDDDEN
jgi:RNA polymerase sigma-70 factor (ECF subfamily)